MPAGEELGIGADGEDRYGVRGVRASGPTDMGLLVEQRDARCAEGVHRFIHVLGVFGFAFAGFLIELVELSFLLGRYLYRLPETEVLTIERFHGFPRRFLILLEELREQITEHPRRAFLVPEQVKVQRVSLLPRARPPVS